MPEGDGTKRHDTSHTRNTDGNDDDEYLEIHVPNAVMCGGAVVMGS